MPEIGGGFVKRTSAGLLRFPFGIAGGGSALRSTFVRPEALTRLAFWFGPRPGLNGNGHTFWESWFFQGPYPTTTGRGRVPIFSRLETSESLHKFIGYASRDYALRKVMDDWFFAASGTFGRPVERSKLQNADGNGVSGWGYGSVWTTRESLTRDLHYANGGTLLQTKMEDWFLGKTAGSADMHILYTYGFYTRDGK